MANQIIADLKQLADPEIAKHSVQFFKAFEGGYGEGDQFLGIRVPEQRKVARKYRNLPLSEVSKLLENSYHEIRLTAIFILVDKYQKGDETARNKAAELLLQKLEAINNWDLVDSSCPYILGPYLEDKDRSLLYSLADSQNIWKRRISIMSCFHFIKNGDFKDALNICKILLNDHHNLVHKATGWMLREIGNRDRDVEEEFLAKYYKKMPRTMLRYAIEKFEDPIRQQYLLGQI